MTDNTTACDPTADPTCGDPTTDTNTTTTDTTTSDNSGDDGSLAHLVLGILMLVNTATPIVFWAAYRYGTLYGLTGTSATAVASTNNYYQYAWNAWLNGASALFAMPTVLWILSFFDIGVDYFYAWVSGIGAAPFSAYLVPLVLFALAAFIPGGATNTTNRYVDFAIYFVLIGGTSFAQIILQDSFDVWYLNATEAESST